MKTRAAFALVGVLAMSIAAGRAEATKDPYLWKYRPVLVFAPDGADAKLRQQKSIIAAQSGVMRERDIVVVYVVGGDVSHAFGPAPGGDASALRARYGVASGAFAALLVGKDGGVKLKSSEPLSAGRLSSVIDAMPMRQDEMQRKPR
jgi:Domain of unknown function (DUF4174)